MGNTFLAVRDGKGFVGYSKEELVDQIVIVNIFHKKVFAEHRFSNDSLELNYIAKSEDIINGYTVHELREDAYKTIFKHLINWGYFTK